MEALFDKVLLIEDEVAHATLINRALKAYCGKVVQVTTAREALSELAVAEFDLIISDLNLPDTGNVDHISDLNDAGKGAPVIALTSSTLLKDAIEVMKRGARDYIVKEFGSTFSEALGLALTRVYSSVAIESERRHLQHKMEVLQIGIENSQDGLAVMGHDGDIDYSNSAFVSFVKKCGGKPGHILEIFGSGVARADFLRTNLEDKLKTLPLGGVWSSEVTFEDDKESAFDLSFSVVKGVGDGSEVQESVIWVRDISEQKRREKFQREILSTTTHDLKGPLGAIVISTELLDDFEENPERAREIILRISSSAHAAINLIDEFLSARRIQEGEFILKPRELLVDEELKEVLSNYRTIAEARSVELDYIVEDPEQSALIDRLGFSRVVGNLLSNAIKFTQKGGKVWLRTYMREGDLHVEVEDTGSGMEPSDVKKIFERFSRLEKHGGVSGSGIGLFVVKSIVSAHGGDISVTSKVGEGTKFEVVFPQNPPVNDRGELISLDFA